MYGHPKGDPVVGQCWVPGVCRDDYGGTWGVRQGLEHVDVGHQMSPIFTKISAKVLASGVLCLARRRRSLWKVGLLQQEDL